MNCIKPEVVSNCILKLIGRGKRLSSNLSENKSMEIQTNNSDENVSETKALIY